MRSGKIPRLRLLGLTFFAMFAVGMAAAQQTWWVQSADWGAGNQKQDVTNTVRRLAGGANFKANNATLGVDPAPGKSKTLRIVARDSGGAVRDFTYKEGSTVNSYMFTGGPNTGRPGWGNTQPGKPGGIPSPGYGGNLRIVSARWGLGSRTQDVAANLQAMVRNGRLSVRITSQTMGSDPAPGFTKFVTVVYQYNGRQSIRTISENQMLNLP